MPPQKIKSFNLKVPLPENVSLWLTREAEIRGMDRGQYIVSVLQKIASGGQVRRKAGTDMEMCNLLYNNLQALFMLRRNLEEKNQQEIIDFCQKTMDIVTKARNFLGRKYVGLDSVQSEELLRVIQISTRLFSDMKSKISDPVFLQKLEKTVKENEETVTIYREILDRMNISHE